MTGALNRVLAVAGTLGLLLGTLGCGSGGNGSAAHPGAGTGGTTSGLDAGTAGNTSDLDSGSGGATSSPDAGDAGGQAQFDPDAPGTKPGAYAVGHVNYMLADTAVYDRTVAVSVWYPVDPTTVTSATQPAQYPLDPWSDNLPVSTSKDWEAFGYDRAYEGPAPSGAGPFPLVLFSPGQASDNWQYLYIGTRLASHGFVVAILDHAADGQWAWSETTWLAATQTVNRVHDVSFAVTELLSKNDSAGELLAGTMDPEKIALSGHSAGGYPLYALTGGDDAFCDDEALVTWGWMTYPYPAPACVPIAQDPRIRAIVPMDGTSQLSRYRELARISIPSLIMGETIEHVTSYQQFPADPDFALWNVRPHAAIRRSDSYRVDVTVANHMSFEIWCDALRLMSSMGVTRVVFNGHTAADFLAMVPCVAQGTFDPANDPATRQIVTTYMLAFLNTVFGREDDSVMLTAEYAAQKQPNVEFFASEACSASLPDATSYTYVPHAGQCQTAEQDPSGYFATSGTAPSVPGSEIQPHGYVVAAVWAGYASPVGVSSTASGAGTTTINPADYSSVGTDAMELCVQGSIGAASDSGGSASIAVSVNQAQSATDGGVPPVQTVAIGGSGISVQYVNPAGTAIRLEIQTPTGGTDPTGRWCANLSGAGGIETVPWTSFWGGVADGTQDCRNSGGINPPVGTEISTVSLYVPGNTAAVPYQFCLDGIAQAL